MHVNTTITHFDGVVLVRVEGVVDRLSAGRLYDTLTHAARLSSKLIIDVSGVRDMTRAGVRGIVVAAHMLSRGGGQTRICGANPANRTLLQSLGYDHLLGFEESLNAALSALRPKLSRTPAQLGAGGIDLMTRPANGGWPLSA
jgi:anti-anti-sigma factor